MGGTRRFKRGNRNFAQKRRDRKQNEDKPQGDPRDQQNRRHYDEIIRENADFEAYYKKQNILPEEEWSPFLSALRRDLPTAFRITGCSASEAKALLEIVEGKFLKQLLDEAAGGEEEIRKPFSLPWYPQRLGWQMQITRKDIRRSESFFRLHNFLILETAGGNISRQEVVSMIPPLLLDIKPNHKVLDMCAAPGSKTAQLIELMHSEEGKVPDGLVIGNDIDNSRCYMLVHQAKRLNSPCIIITNHDSSIMPNFYVNNDSGNRSALKFDRILCDVPCTGDGTLRKNADIWMKWNTANGNNLHGVQSRIVKRAVEMLAIGGRLVYSTCSLNPLENEAVMHRLIVESEGAVHLVDEKAHLPGLISVPGLSNWYPMSRDMVPYDAYEEVPEKWQTQVRPQMFPPSKDDYEKYHLDRCIRILPHHQDTGGFFVAVVEKTRPLPWEAAKEANSTGEASMAVAEEGRDDRRNSQASSSGPDRKRRRIQGYKEDPFVFFEESDPIWPSIRDFFDLDPSILNGLLTRCAVGKKKNIYFTSPAAKDIIINNQDRVKIINSGVKSFVRCDNKKTEDGCSFRLAQEGLQTVARYIGKRRRVAVTRDDLITLLGNDDPTHPPETTLLDPATQERIQDLGHGSCILEYHGEDGLDFTMVGWRGMRSMRAYVPLNDSVHYLRLLGADISKFEKNKFKKDAPDETETAGEGKEKEPEEGNGDDGGDDEISNGNDNATDTLCCRREKKEADATEKCDSVCSGDGSGADEKMASDVT